MKKVLITFLAFMTILPFVPTRAGGSCGTFAESGPDRAAGIFGEAVPGCVAGTFAESVPVCDGGESIAEDLVRIKFSGTARLPGESVFSAGNAETGDKALDEALNSVGATGIRRVFADGGKFAARRRRHGLHLWYEVKLDGSVPVADAIALLAAVRSVDYAGPVYKARIQE